MPRPRARKKAGTVPLKRRKKGGVDVFDLEAYLAELKVEVEARCKTILLQSEHHADSLRNFFAIELTKLPKKVRSMTVKTFCEEYDGDLDLVLQYDRQKVLEDMRTLGDEMQEAAAATVVRGVRTRNRVPLSAKPPLRKAASQAAHGSSRSLRSRATTRRAQAVAAAAGETPMRLDPRLPFTPAGNGTRLPRRGESIVSIRGSPLGSFASAPVAAGLHASIGGPAAVPNEVSGDDALNTVSMEVGGKMLDLANPKTQQLLQGQDRENAVEQLQAMQSQLSELLAKFQQ